MYQDHYIFYIILQLSWGRPVPLTALTLPLHVALDVPFISCLQDAVQLAIFCSRTSNSLEGWGPAGELCKDVLLLHPCVFGPKQNMDIDGNL